jgi:hypothetical protein
MGGGVTSVELAAAVSNAGGLGIIPCGRHCQLVGHPVAWQSCGMDTLPTTIKYKNHRFPVEIISHAVWLYFRFCLSFRDVQEILLERGVSVTYEAIRKWCRKFGQQYANQLRRRRPRPGDKWHMDEVFLTIKGGLPICGARSIKTGTCSIF